MSFIKFDPAEDFYYHHGMSKRVAETGNSWPHYHSLYEIYFMLEGKRIKVFASKTGDKTDKPAATVISSDGELTVACADGTSLILTEIQPEGSKRMSAKDYLIGHSIEKGKILYGENNE
mgnify:CR=1 FL=1